MDPVSATIGLVSGITTIVGVIGGSVTTLNNIRVNASDAELNIELLIGQLQTVQAALRQVQAFLASLATPIESYDQQLIFDLDNSLNHCKLLVHYVDNQISKFAWTPGSRIRGQRLITVILEDKATKDCLTRLDHQISALNLCLTAFRCRTLSNLPPKEVPAFEDGGADPAIVNLESAFSWSASNALSRTRSVDDEVPVLSKSPTSSRGPSPTGSSSLIARPSSPTGPPSERRPSEFLSPLGIRGRLARSARLDNLIKRDAVKRTRHLRILALGRNRSSIVKQLRINLGQRFDANELENHRRAIVSLVIYALLSVVKYVENTNGAFVSKQSCSHVKVLRQYGKSASPEFKIEEDIARATVALWGNWHVQQVFQNMNQDCVTAYFLKSTIRIMQQTYIPSSVDIIRVPESVTTVRENRLDLNNGLTVDLIEPPQSGLQKILRQFEDTDGCLAYIDISLYDQYLDGDTEVTGLRRTLGYFKAIFQTGMFASKALLLCLVNTTAFEEKLAISPLKECFPNYTGGNDKRLALQYVLKKCKEAMMSTDFLYIHFAKDTEDPTTVQFFKNKAEGLKTALEVSRHMGFFTASDVISSGPTPWGHHRSRSSA